MQPPCSRTLSRSLARKTRCNAARTISVLSIVRRARTGTQLERDMEHVTLEIRLAACERHIRHLRRALRVATGLLLCTGALAFTGFAVGRASTVAGNSAATDSMRVRELIVVDDSGTVRARIGGNLPDAIYHGRRVPRGDQAAGVLLYDTDGLERGGYVTFDRTGVVALTLDNRGQQVAIFGADSTPGAGATARLWRGSDWAEMKVDQAGPHFAAGRNGAIAFMQPSMTGADAHAMCTELKAEVARVKPAPSNSVILAACRSHAPDGVCRKCLGVRR